MTGFISIAARLRFLAVSLVLGTALGVGVVVYGGFTQLLDWTQRDALAQLTRLESNRMIEALYELEHDTEFLANLPATQMALETFLDEGSADAPALEVAADAFDSALTAKIHYAQTRLIAADSVGQEVLRFNVVDDRPTRVPNGELQAKGHRDYVIAGLAQEPGQVYFSPITLNRENGEIQLPLRAMLRASAAIVGPDGVVGLLLINLDFGQFVAARFQQTVRGRTLFIANDDGEYLIADDARRTFAFEFDQHDRVQDEFPVLRPLFAGHERAVTERLPDRRIISARKVTPFPGEPNRFLVFGYLASYEDIVGREASILASALWTTLLLVAVALGLAIFFAARLVRPLRAIAAAAADIEEGAPSATLPVERRDEIGRMARALQKMTDTIRQKEAALGESNATLASANADLEQFVHLASHDLHEPVRRLSALADLLITDLAVLPADDADLVRRIGVSARDISTRIQELRAFARVGEGTLARAPRALDALFREVLANFQADLDARDVKVEIAPLPTLPVYPWLAAALFRELIENALEHTTDNQFTLSVRVEGDVLVVANTAASIPAARLDQVVRPFVRGAGSKGAGMGLAIASRIATRHGGRLWVTSTENTVEVRFTLGGRDGA